ncbi:MAG: glutamate-1-semialdehyde 2,1-aminomutase [Calditrichaceae bacterium]|nr:glutamate-1-semialdehyde 2,1-aminomutase [Calditrichaceae bacterium]MBN2709655.1 glutamate-1-semialdehyde 2,1-aminomutase [Calditrichaceae bacterium]RQV92449.1 MAG: glutamate-1-semialdehyde-2,1-aminomutase [Calditrichota bacterium]
MTLSSELFKKAQRFIPGGVNSPVRAFRSVKLDPLFIASGKGSKITDVDGNTYIDYVGSWGPLILGHAHEEVVEAVVKTAEKGTSFGAPTELEIQMAEKIVKTMPCVEMARMVNSGTEATMSAIRLARGYTGRDKIIKFEGCYHGHGDSFLIKAGSGALTMGEPNSPGVPRDSAKHTLIADFNHLESVENLFMQYGETIAAVIVEPVAGNMGVILPEDGFLQGLRRLCDQNKSLLIADEVMTGFRIHPAGAQGLFNFKADLTTMGKVIGGGLPVGAYGGRKDIMANVSPSGPVYQAGTLSGNPLAMAAGLKTLEIISRPDFYYRLNKISNEFFNQIQDRIESKGWPLSLNHVNSMGCLFFKSGGVMDYKDAVTSDTDKFADYFAGLLENGIYIAPSQFEALFISAAHSETDLQKTLEVMESVLNKLF